MTNTNLHEPVSFVIKRFSENNMRGELRDAFGHKVSETLSNVCADQCAYQATRSGRRPLRYDGMVGVVDGEWAAIETDSHCNVNPSDWTWQHHYFTHGALSRCSGAEGVRD